MAILDWTGIATIASTVALVMSGSLWLASRIFNLGKTSQRLDAIETDLASFKQDVNAQFTGVRQEINNSRHDLNQRMDKLILTIAESNRSR